MNNQKPLTVGNTTAAMILKIVQCNKCKTLLQLESIEVFDDVNAMLARGQSVHAKQKPFCIDSELLIIFDSAFRQVAKIDILETDIIL